MRFSSSRTFPGQEWAARRPGPRRNGDVAFAQGLEKLVEKHPDEQENVVAPVAQRRYDHAQHVEPVVEVAAEGVVFHGLGQILVGGGDDAHVDALGLLAAQARDLAFLEQAQQADLGFQGHFPDFVEENGTTVGQLEFARAAFLEGAGKGAGHIAEQFALDQGPGQGAAVDHHEGAFAPGTAVVDGLGEKFLARAGLAENEGRGVALGGDLGELYGVADGLGFADDVVEGIDRLGADDLGGVFAHAPGLAQGQDDPAAFGERRAGQGALEHAVAKRNRGFAVVKGLAPAQGRTEHVAWPVEFPDVFPHHAGIHLEHLAGLPVDGEDGAVAAEHDDAVVEQFEDDALLGEQGAQPDLLLHGVGGGLHQPQGVWWNSR
jgi:hypothetical protein